MSSESTAVALFYVRNEAGDTNYAVLEAVSASGLYIMGNIQTMMPKG
jgi:Na+/H+ antiporter NhaC